ncbi:2-hydroxyacid dehydrogenase [Actinomycetospora cinnamomea]|uniref:Glycerate dehydrogenase n=1 Tax=Actinomycetospora cinnamomea TaxID=663609 RepID=A0A2U1F7P7_9PSEU|nr:2-hydroxyacid dehydrogenase [Actinomycetospora cinnamomea]PVZ08217.1 glycerate dehydrogenase [Actinomycetospora cinnamomea]
MTDPDPHPVAIIQLPPDRVSSHLKRSFDELVQSAWVETLEECTNEQKSIARILVAANGDLGRNSLVQLPSLNLVVCIGTAYDNVDLDYCKENGIVVANTPGYAGPSVAEHALALMMSLNRRVCEINSHVQAGHVDTTGFIARDLRDKTAGIFGLGDIGGRIASMVDAIGMKVIFTSRQTKTFPGARQVDRETLLRESDILFLSAPLTDDTADLVNRQTLSSMKPSAQIINISADELIIGADLVASIKADRLGGAALDVIGDPAVYRGQPKIILTHLNGWWTIECQERWAETWMSSVRAYLTHGSVGAVNVTAGD